MNLSGLLPQPKNTEEPLHAGVYKVKAVSADTFLSVNNHPYVRLRYANDQGLATEYLYFTTTALKGTLRKLAILGWSPSDSGWDISKIITDTEHTLPEEAVIEISDIEFEGVITPRVVSLTGKREKSAKVLKFLSELKHDPDLVQTISEGLTQKLIAINEVM